MFMNDPATDLTVLLGKMKDGDTDAASRVISVVYPELRRIARSYMARERISHTLEPTALIHEAWLRLVDQTRVDWRDRAHFFGVAASMMRRVLVDHARQRLADKRGSGMRAESLDGLELPGGEQKLEEILSVHEALERLGRVDQQQTKVVEMRYFAGMEVDEIAAVLSVSPRTVDREWAMGRAWLQVELARKNPS